MSTCYTIMQRELADYFYTPIAYVFLVIFLLLNSILTFYVGGFFERGQADLETFFLFHPWLYLVLAPALGMRLWAEERQSGTIQLLLTMPIRVGAAVIGKFLASWLFAGFALMLTTPLWVTVNYLGSPDNGVIFSSYFGSWLMAGAYLGVSSCMSALTQNQVLAFVASVATNLLFMLSGFAFVQDLLTDSVSNTVLEWIFSMNFLSHFLVMTKGVVSLSNLVFFASVTVLFLYINTVAINSEQNR